MTDLIAAARALTMRLQYPLPEYVSSAVDVLDAALSALPSTPVALVEVALIEEAADALEDFADLSHIHGLTTWPIQQKADALRRSLGQGGAS